MGIVIDAESLQLNSVDPGQTVCSLALNLICGYNYAI